MTVNLDWPADLVHRLNKEARQLGISLDAYVLEKVLRPESGRRAATPDTIPPLRPYQKRWISKEGASFRQDLYARQRKKGSEPLVDNPSVDEIKTCIRKHAPQRVLEVGCGWGRLLEDLVSEFDVYGCDISSDLLSRADKSLKSKLLSIDIAEQDPELASMYKGTFDVLFTRGVMQELMDDPDLILQAMKNMEQLANTRTLVWEWPEVCELMQSLHKSDSFEYYPIKHRPE